MKVLIIGHKGSYGSWLLRLMEKRMVDYDIVGIDRGETEKENNFAKFVSEADVVINSASITSSSKILKFVSEHINDKGFIIDISTSKKEVYPILEDVEIDYLMIHPMCAPPSSCNQLDKSRKVYVVEAQQPKQSENLDFWKEFKQIIGGKYVPVSLEMHYKIEELQAASHLAALVMSAALSSTDLTLKELRDHSTPVSDFFYDGLERFLMHGNPVTTAKNLQLALEFDSEIISAMTDFVSNIDKRSNANVSGNFIYVIEMYFRKFKDKLNVL